MLEEQHGAEALAEEEKEKTTGIPLGSDSIQRWEALFEALKTSPNMFGREFGAAMAEAFREDPKHDDDGVRGEAQHSGPSEGYAEERWHSEAGHTSGKHCAHRTIRG